MIPLLPKSDNNKSQFWSKIWFLSTILIFIVTISIISYFNVGSTSLHNNNPAKSLYKHRMQDGDANNIIPSDVSAASEYYKSSGYDDEILSMPNLVESTCSTSPTNCGFKQYSGYLLGNNNVEIHYWFITADSVEDASSKPIFFWTNGGPGCSGMDGLLTEHGPWRVMNNLDVVYNQYSWITEVNMVYLEQPFGVGFSTNGNEEVVAGDVNAANDMDAVIRNFLIKFPEYKDNQIYLSSESWGGHYVPITTYTILQNNDAGATPYINFGGFLLGNPYTDWYENTYGFVGDIYGHGLMTGSDWDHWRETCWDNEYNVDNDVLCSAIYTRAYISSWNSNVYALDWPQCIYDEEWSAKQYQNKGKYQYDAHLHHHAKIFMKRVIDHSNYDELQMRLEKHELMTIYDQLMNQELHTQQSSDSSLSALSETYSIMTDSYVPCIEYNMADWLNLEQVQTALNVKPTTWEMCSDPVWNAWPESDYDTFIEDYYAEIIDNYVVDKNLKLCIYSGDDDSVCGLQGTQYWLDRDDTFVPNPEIQWVPWQDSNQQLGGYYTQYMISNDDQNVGLHFVTVRTAGHMVPTTQPLRALDLLKKYLYEM